MRILVIGGAGFIGSHTVDALVGKGHEVRVFDNLDPQVHKEDRPPDYFNPAAEFVQGDVRDLNALRQALSGIDVVFFLGAAVGVGQSMYEIRRYVEVNTLGAANFLQLLAEKAHSVRKIVVASSMSVYGEGKYSCPEHGPMFPALRPREQLSARQWEVRCPVPTSRAACSAPLTPLPTDEAKPLAPTSVYAITKRDHEEMFLTVGRAYDVPTVALRYFNVYGPRQALSNPYTGVVAIFASRFLNQKQPLVYEDGLQSRDFVHVRDIVQANLLAMEHEAANYEVVNVGTGRPTTVLEIAATMAEALGHDGKPEIMGRYRAGDIRHCYADITKIQKVLPFKPHVSLREGIRELLQEWAASQVAHDEVQKAHQELVARGLIQ